MTNTSVTNSPSTGTTIAIPPLIEADLLRIENNTYFKGKEYEMITRQELEGKWNQLKGKVLEQWGELTDDDIQVSRGNTDELVGVIQEKTGVGRREIENFIEETLSDEASAVSEFAQTAREQYEKATERVQAGYRQAEGFVRERPVESVAVAFGSGMITGIILGLVLKR